MIPTKIIHNSAHNKKLPDRDDLRFLLVQIAGIGDLVLATPAIDALYEKYPTARIDLLTSPAATTILKHHPALHSIYGFNIQEFKHPKNLKSGKIRCELKTIIKELRKNHYDAVLSLNNVSSVRGGVTLGFLLKSLEIPIWAGRNTDGRASYFDYEVEDFLLSNRHEVMTKLAVAAQFELKPAIRPLNLPVPEELKHKTAEYLPPSEKWIVIHAGSNRAARCLPLVKFIQVAAELSAQGYAIATVGGPDEIDANQKILDACPGNSVNLAGKLNLLETAAAFSHATLAICNNSGPMHIAAA
ncbi:glycosyltransferase family 9 protein, partial [bacterium]|nr:glycosyltransferase family 9 protein [bacterium]